MKWWERINWNGLDAFEEKEVRICKNSHENKLWRKKRTKKTNEDVVGYDWVETASVYADDDRYRVKWKFKTWVVDIKKLKERWGWREKLRYFSKVYENMILNKVFFVSPPLKFVRKKKYVWL